MKVLGFILIALGIFMFAYRQFSFTTEKKVLDVGPLEVNKKEEKTLGWPVYAGGIAMAAGVFLLMSGKKKT